MTANSDDHERTMAFAEIALGQIKALRQPATPRIYEVWYSYATGYNPSLNETINETLARNGTLSETDIDQIYETYLSPTRLGERIDKVGNRVMDEIEQVMSMVDAAVGTRIELQRKPRRRQPAARQYRRSRGPAQDRGKPRSHREGNGEPSTTSSKRG